jgi:hypothetical protein
VNRCFQSIKSHLVGWNLFRDRSTDPEKIRKQIVTTRLYVIVFIVSLSTLVLCTSLNNKSITVNVALSSLTQYQQLEMKYGNLLVCPCNRISIKYEQFVQLQPFYHEVCSSDFVSQSWIEYLYIASSENDRSFRSSASSQFQALASICQLSEENINANLFQFYATKLISEQVISNQSFDKQVDSILNLFQKSMPRSFKRTLDMVRGMIQGNLFLSVTQTNWKFTILQRKQSSPFYTNPITYNNSCTCGTSATCSQPAELIQTIIDGLVIGCYPVEAILQSNLQCLYNQSCLDYILSYFQQTTTVPTYRLLSSNPQFGINEKVQNMVDRLFVEQWFTNRSYQNYFQQCNPTSCTYSYIQHFQMLYIITTILGVYSGLTVILGVATSFIIHIIFRLISKRKNDVVPLTPTYSSDIDKH